MRKILFPTIMIALFVAASCQPKQEEATTDDSTQTAEPTLEQATELAKKIIITDGHVDLPLQAEGEDVSNRERTGRCGCKC